MPVIEGLAADRDFAGRRHTVVLQSTRLSDRESLWFGLYQQWIADRLYDSSADPKAKVRAKVAASAVVAALVEIIDQWYSDDSIDIAGYYAELINEMSQAPSDPLPRW
jgi:hypothetical protein